MMKLKYVDAKNCHLLLPNSNSYSIVGNLDEYLSIIAKTSESHGKKIQELIVQNKCTIGKSKGSKRLIQSSLHIIANLNPRVGPVQFNGADMPIPGPAYFHLLVSVTGNITHKIIVPLQFLLKGWGDAGSGYQGYVHSFSKNVIGQQKTLNDLAKRIRSDSDTYYYVGITKRDWLKRLNEHLREMKNGNRRLFYAKWRELFGGDRILFDSVLREVNLTEVEIMNWEEEQVDLIASDEYGLNMIPGGYKGNQFLHKYGITSRENISFEDRKWAVAEYERRNPRKGIPNPFLSELWKEDGFYDKVISARSNTLSKDQVHQIRELNTYGWSIPGIVIEVGAIDERQVRDVISGKHYSKW
jgi:hypothetical protein